MRQASALRCALAAACCCCLAAACCCRRAASAPVALWPWLLRCGPALLFASPPVPGCGRLLCGYFSQTRFLGCCALACGFLGCGLARCGFLRPALGLGGFACGFWPCAAPRLWLFLRESVGSFAFKLAYLRCCCAIVACSWRCFLFRSSTTCFCFTCFSLS